MMNAKATIAGYEAHIAKSESQEDQEALGNNRETLGNEWENLGKHLEEAQKHNIILEERLSKVPDPVEFAKVQVHFEGM
jgi:predicted nuclease with TOPRIM domain